MDFKINFFPRAIYNSSRALLFFLCFFEEAAAVPIPFGLIMYAMRWGVGRNAFSQFCASACASDSIRFQRI